MLNRLLHGVLLENMKKLLTFHFEALAIVRNLREILDFDPLDTYSFR